MSHPETAAVSVTFDGVADDGAPGEGDNVLADVEQRATEFTEDLLSGAVARGGNLFVDGGVWSGSPTLFSVTTVADTQVVAYYEVEGLPGQRVCFATVAARRLGSTTWTYKKPLWSDSSCFDPADTHHKLTVVLDDQGLAHVAGGMHNSAMRYFRTSASVFDDPANIATMASYPLVEPSGEQGVTYPNFCARRMARCCSSSRSGPPASVRHGWPDGIPSRRRGHGRDRAVVSWDPSVDPDGLFGDPQEVFFDGAWRIAGGFKSSEHLANGDSKFGKHVFYASSPDFGAFSNAHGEPVTLPILQTSTSVIVDSPPNGGIRAVNMAFDHQNRPMLGYAVYDDPSNMFCGGPQEGKLMGRVAIYDGTSWQKVNIWCSTLAWSGEGSDDPFFFSVWAPDDWTDDFGQRKYIVALSSQGSVKQFFTIDPDTLVVTGPSTIDPRGAPEPQECPPAIGKDGGRWIDRPRYPPESPYYKYPWQEQLNFSTGDAEAESYYWLTHDASVQAYGMQVDLDVNPEPALYSPELLRSVVEDHQRP